MCDNGGESILDAAVKNLTAGRDDRGFFQPVGQQLQNGAAPGGCFRCLQLLFVDDQGDDPGPAELIAGAHGRVAVAGGNHDLIDAVNGQQRGAVDAKQPVAGGGQLNFAFFDGRAGHAVVFTQAAQPRGGVVFMQHARPALPDIEVLLAHGEQYRDILRCDDVALAETGVLIFAGDDLRHIMTEHMPDGVNGFHQLHTRLLSRSGGKRRRFFRRFFPKDRCF